MVLKYKEILESYNDEVAGMLRDLVSFKSVKSEPGENKPFGDEIHKAYRYMLSKAEQEGFEVFDADGYGGHIEWRGAVTDERGEITGAADETLGIAVHLDVVPPGDGWTHDPWGGEISDGRIYGRGAIDNKGPAAMVFYAMMALREAGHIPAKNVRLIIGLDEETGCEGMDKYLGQTTAPDFGFAPDSDFPVINGEMGILVFEIAKKLEPSVEKGLSLRSMDGGAAPNMVPDYCRAILVFEDGAADKSKKPRSKGKAKTPAKEPQDRNKAFSQVKDAALSFRERTGSGISCRGTGNALEVSARGVSAHGATPWKGKNAISVLIDFLSTLPLVNESARDFVDFYHTRIGYETDGKSLSIFIEDSLSGPLIFNAGMIDMNREAVVLTVNVRYPVSKKENDVYDALRPIIDENGLGIIKLTELAPLYYETGDPLIKTLVDVYRDNTGDMESEPLVIGGGTYARSIPNSVAYGPLFPDDEEVMHQKDEYISIDSLMKAAQIYADAIYLLTSGNDNNPVL